MESRRRKTLMACLAMTIVIALPGVARAGDNGEATEEETTTTTTPPYQVNEVVQTLPVLGAGLAVTITRDEAGAITVVGLDDATVVKEKDHKIAFLLADGATEVVVKAKNGFVQTKVKAKATADVTGPGTWMADVFGNGDVLIPYDVSFSGNTPTITIGAITTPSGVTAEVGEPKTRTSEDGDKAVFKVKVALTSGEESAKVSFVAKVRVDDDGQVKVRLAVSLSSHDRVECRDGEDRGDREGRHGDRWNKDDGDNQRADRNRGDDDGDRRGDRGGDEDDHDRDGEGGRGRGGDGDGGGRDGDGGGGDN